jgi:hypothetical protein
MMAMTTSSSINVNARLVFITVKTFAEKNFHRCRTVAKDCRRLAGSAAGSPPGRWPGRDRPLWPAHFDWFRRGADVWLSVMKIAVALQNFILRPAGLNPGERILRLCCFES